MHSETPPEKLQYPKLMAMKKRELQNHLNALLKKGEPRLVVNTMRDIVLRQKEELRRKRIHLTTSGRLWDEVIKPLQAERRALRGCLTYKADDEADPRVKAYRAYQVVLDELIRRLKALKQEGAFTPSTYAQAKNYPNHGLHWTDFVPIKIKLRITALFDDIPPKPKAKRKHPFERLVNEDIHARRKHKLIERTTKELLRASQDNALNPSDEAQARIATIRRALIRIEQLNPTEPVPTTWHGLY